MMIAVRLLAISVGFLVAILFRSALSLWIVIFSLGAFLVSTYVNKTKHVDIAGRNDFASLLLSGFGLVINAVGFVYGHFVESVIFVLMLWLVVMRVSPR